MGNENTTTISHQIALFSAIFCKCLLILALAIPSLPALAHKTSLSNFKKLNNIIQDKEGYIWVAGHNGVTRYDGERTITFAENEKYWKAPYIWANEIHLADGIGNTEMLIATENHGVWQLDSASGASTPVDDDVGNKSIYNVFYFKEHIYFYTTSPKAIYKYSQKTKKTTQLSTNKRLVSFFSWQERLFGYNSEELFEFTGESVVTLKEGSIDLLANTRDAVFYVSGESLVKINSDFEEYVVPLNRPLMAITNSADKSQIFTLDFDGKITLYDQGLNELQHRYKGVKNKVFEKMYHDTSSTLWLLNNQETIRLSQKPSTNLPHIFNTSTNAMDISPLNGTLAIGSFGDGLQNFKGHASIFPDDINAQLSSRAKRIMDTEVFNDELYFATFDGLWVYNLNTQKISRVNIGNNTQILLKIRIVEDKMYIGTDQNGFIIYDLMTKKVERIIDASYQFTSPEIIDILPVNTNKIWLATSKGIDIYDPLLDEITSLILPIASKVISLEISEGKIFASTKGNGIFVFNFSKQLLARVGENINFSYIREVSDLIWAPSDEGLFTLDPKNYQLTLIPSTQNYAFASEPVELSGKVYAPHYTGIIEVPLFDQKYFNANIKISEASVSGTKQIDTAVIKAYSANDLINLNLASLDYRQGQQKSFQYRINNQEWQDVLGSQISLTGLNSGQYRVTVRGTNSLGQWSKNEAYSLIEVAFPWYWTPKIKILYILLILSSLIILLWVLFLRAKSIKQIHNSLTNNAKKHGKAALNISKNLHYSLELLSKNNSDSDDINQAKETIREAISDLESQSRHNEPDSLEGKSLGTALPYLAEFMNKKYHVLVKVSVDMNEQHIKYEIKADIYRIIYEALTSAVANGDGSEFSIQLQVFKDKIWLTISDNKNSFIHFNNKLTFDMSMYYIRQIGNKHHASINTFDEEEKGSQLVINIPL